MKPKQTKERQRWMSEARQGILSRLLRRTRHLSFPDEWPGRRHPAHDKQPIRIMKTILKHTTKY